MGHKFTVNSDQASLRWLLEIAEPSGRLTRWRLRLSEFDFEVKYKKGKLNTHADALSRLQTSGGTTIQVDEEIPCFSVQEDTQNGQDLLDPYLAEADELFIVSAQDSYDEL